MATAIPVRAESVIKLVICSVQDIIELEANYRAWENSQYLKASLPKEWEEYSKDIPELNHIVAHSAAMQSLLRSLLQVAKVDSTYFYGGTRQENLFSSLAAFIKSSKWTGTFLLSTAQLFRLHY